MIDSNDTPDRPTSCTCGTEGCSNQAMLDTRVHVHVNEAGEKFLSLLDVADLLERLTAWENDVVQMKLAHVCMGLAQRGQPLVFDPEAAAELMYDTVRDVTGRMEWLLRSNVTHVPEASTVVPDTIPETWGEAA